MRIDASDAALITEHLRRNLSPEEIEEGRFLERLGEKKLRIELAEMDLAFFARFYLRNHFSLNP